MSSAFDRKFRETVAKTLEIKVEDVCVEKSREHFTTWDSLKHLELMLALEKSFSVRFSSQEIAKSIELDSIRELIRSKTS